MLVSHFTPNSASRLLSSAPCVFDVLPTVPDGAALFVSAILCGFGLLLRICGGRGGKERGGRNGERAKCEQEGRRVQQNPARCRDERKSRFQLLAFRFPSASAVYSTVPRAAERSRGIDSSDGGVRRQEARQACSHTRSQCTPRPFMPSSPPLCSSRAPIEQGNGTVASEQQRIRSPRQPRHPTRAAPVITPVHGRPAQGVEVAKGQLLCA